MYFNSCSGAAPALRRLHAHFCLGGAVEEKSNRWDWSALVAFFTTLLQWSLESGRFQTKDRLQLIRINMCHSLPRSFAAANESPATVHSPRVGTLTPPSPLQKVRQQATGLREHALVHLSTPRPQTISDLHSLKQTTATKRRGRQTAELFFCGFFHPLCCSRLRKWF